MNLSFRGPVRSWLRILFTGVAVSAGAGLAACHGTIGSGNSPQRVVIAAPSTTIALPTLHMYECLTSGLRALLYFSDNSVGDFTARVVWSSSNPGAVKVSNGDIQIPGTSSFYAAGVLIPQGAGNAIITADYFGLISQTAITVDAPQSVDIKALIEGVYTPLNRVNLNSTSSSTAFTLGAGTALQLAATAKLNGAETDVTSFATFGFQNPNNSVATIATGGSTINAVGNSTDALVPVVSFPSCPLTNLDFPTRAGVSFTVSPVQTLSLVPEFLPDPTQPASSSNASPPLVIGTTEKFTVVAQLSSGDLQDVSAQSAYVSSSSNAVFTGGVGTLGNNILSVTAVGPLFVQANLTANGRVISTGSMSVPAVSRTLSAISACWTDVNVVLPAGQNCPANQSTPSAQGGSLTPVQFHAVGFFGYDNDANGNPTIPFYQEVTRATTWSTVPAGVASISNTQSTAGQALGTAANGGSTFVEGNNTNAQNLSQTNTQLIVLPVVQGN